MISVNAERMEEQRDLARQRVESEHAESMRAFDEWWNSNDRKNASPPFYVPDADRNSVQLVWAYAFSAGKYAERRRNDGY